MKRTHALVAMALISVGLFGCYSHTQYRGVNPLKVVTGKYSENIIINERASVWLTFVESPGYDESTVDEKCPNKRGSIMKSRGFAQSLVMMVTLGIYHSIDVQIGCEKDSTVATTMTITPKQIRALVADERFLEIVGENFPTLLPDAEAAHGIAIQGIVAAR